LLRQHGDSPGATQASPEGQRFRFHKLLELAPLDGCSVLDVGSGIGDFFPIIRDRFREVRYHGIEVVPEMVDLAAAKYPEASFRVANLLVDPIAQRYDYVFLSQIFNNAVEGSSAFLEGLVAAAWPLATRGLGFNFISTHVNFTNPEMAYHDPAGVLDFCVRHLSRRVVLHHHYDRCDVAVFVYR
jgi:hypothetical protein